MRRPTVFRFHSHRNPKISRPYAMATAATFPRSGSVLLMLLLAIAVRFPADVRCDRRPSPFVTPFGTYTSNYDHMDVNQLLKNDKLVTAYIKCFLGEARCTPEGRQVKGARTLYSTGQGFSIL